MVRRKSSQSELKAKIELAAARDEAEKKITERIAKGRKIR